MRNGVMFDRHRLTRFHAGPPQGMARSGRRSKRSEPALFAWQAFSYHHVPVRPRAGRWLTYGSGSCQTNQCHRFVPKIHTRKGRLWTLTSSCIRPPFRHASAPRFHDSHIRTSFVCPTTTTTTPESRLVCCIYQHFHRPRARLRPASLVQRRPSRRLRRPRRHEHPLDIGQFDPWTNTLTVRKDGAGRRILQQPLEEVQVGRLQQSLLPCGANETDLSSWGNRAVGRPSIRAVPVLTPGSRQDVPDHALHVRLLRQHVPGHHWHRFPVQGR